jgi:hypothetical protein
MKFYKSSFQNSNVNIYSDALDSLSINKMGKINTTSNVVVSFNNSNFEKVNIILEQEIKAIIHNFL